MNEQFSRYIALIGEENFNKISRSNILIFFFFLVGGQVVETLARCGVSHFTLVDADKVDVTNINRQIIANSETVGEYKTEVFKKRILSINNAAEVRLINKFILPNDLDEIDFKSYDYVVDCIDTITTKIAIICKAKENNIQIISALGAGNRLDPTKLLITDIYKTTNDPLAKTLRHELRKRDIKSLKVVFSMEESKNVVVDNNNGRHSPASSAFVPSTMGIYIASEIINDLIKKAY